MDMVLNEARAAIRAAAPLILDMAADVVDDAEYAGFVRQLKERFQ
jgi:ABC-type molybdenum transport system ATPase subunit/photorepair protein PhrA